MWASFFEEYFTNGFQRPAAGFFSWQHLAVVIPGLLIMTFLALYFGKKRKNASFDSKLKVLKIAAIVMDGAELVKLTLTVIEFKDFSVLLSILPLFLCSIQLIALPLAAFTKGRVQKAMLDFVFVFGLLGAILGTLMAGNIYSYYPALHFAPLVSMFTHGIAGFASLYIGIAGLATMEKKNIAVTVGTFLCFLVVAEFVNLSLHKNYMFLVTPDGTPFEIVWSWTQGNPVLYPILVSILMVLYMGAFYGVYYAVKSALAKKTQRLADAHA